jgi:hypothetical protein
MNQFDGSNREKQNREIPGRIIRPGGADNPAPLKFFPNACCNTQIDRSGEEDHTT